MMRKISYLILLLILPFVGLSQNNNVKGKTLKIAQKSKLIGDVTIGSSSFDASAILTITSGTQGALMPRMNTTARDNISTPADGLLIFNTQTAQYEFFETTWQAVGGGGADGDGIYDGSGSLTANPTTVTGGANKIQFASTIVDGFSVDGTTFSVDANNNRVGIGTTTPTQRFNVNGNSQFDGLIGIGAVPVATTRLTIAYQPSNQVGLDVTTSSTGTGQTGIRVINTNTGGASLSQIQALSDNGAVNMVISSIGATAVGAGLPSNTVQIRAFGSASPDMLFQLGTGTITTKMSILNGGNVGIGITPTQKFHISGNSRFDGTIGINTAPISEAKLLIDYEPASNSGLKITTNSTGSSQPSIRVINTNTTTTSLSQLVVESENGAVIIALTSIGAAALGAGLPSNTVQLRAFGTNAPDMLFQLGAGTVTTKMKITNAGNIGMGLLFDSPLARLHVAGVNAASTDDAFLVTDNTHVTSLLQVENAGDIGINNDDPTAKLHVIGDVIIDSIFSIPTKSITLGVAATTFIIQGNKMEITGDGGGNTITTITGGVDGLRLVLTFVDALVTLTDDNSSTANTINLPASFTSTANDIVVLEFKSGSWRQASQSVN